MSSPHWEGLTHVILSLGGYTIHMGSMEEVLNNMDNYGGEGSDPSLTSYIQLYRSRPVNKKAGVLDPTLTRKGSALNPFVS